MTIYHEIDETFSIKEKSYVFIESENSRCTGCCFDGDTDMCSLVECVAVERKDSKNVIVKEIKEIK